MAGNFDLSMGSIVGLVSTFIVYLFTLNYPIYLVIILSLILGIIIGFINGIIVKVVGINSIITTLGTASILTGAAYLINAHIGAELILNDSFLGISRTFYGGSFPAIFLYMIIAFVIAGFILKYTKFGRNVYCVGGNYEIARVAGIKSKRIQIITFMISGLMCSIAAVILSSKLGAGRPDFGKNLTLGAIAVCVLGGILLSGGKGDLLGVFIALLFLNSITNGLVMWDVPIYLRYVIAGAFLIIAIVVNEVRYRKKVLYQ